MGVETVMAGIGIGSQIAGGIMGYEEQRRAGRRQRQLGQQANGMMMNYPTEAERQLQAMFSGMRNGTAPGMQGFNTGQDAILQMLRSGALQGTAATGNPFDLSSTYAALDPIEARIQTNQLNTLRAGPRTLGARFGTAAATQEANLLAQLGEQQAGRRSQLAQGAYEAAQARMLQAQGLVGQLGGQVAGLGLAQQGQMANLLQMLQGATMQRQGFNANLLGMQMGQQPMIGMGQGIAQGGMDIATLLYLMNRERGGGGGGGGTSLPTPQLPVFTPPVFNPRL